MNGVGWLWLWVEMGERGEKQGRTTAATRHTPSFVLIRYYFFLCL